MNTARTARKTPTRHPGHPAAPVLRGLALAGLLWSAAACEQPTAPVGTPSPASPRDPAAAIAPSDTTLSFVVAEETASSLVVDLVYQRPAGTTAGPRAAEIWLQPSADLSYVSAEPLAAVTAADKDLHVQSKSEGLRVLLFSARNLDELDSGGLARFRFTRGGDTAGPSTLEVQDRAPLFAPAAANEGLRLPPALRVGGE